jgi:hypothetical protein
MLSDAHAGLRVTTEAFDRLTEHLAGALRDLGVAPTVLAEVVERLDGMRYLVIDAGGEPAGSGARGEGERAR